ncbi:hypothetical protein [Stigmatella aurantiaca]|uniref:hypothetical protein n=1 Tax=Stigmatella aurantiaca TaxID=41 RepID=UPI001160814B|nr:hypothetical protein [Stigmatella aurantiaca]
MRLSLGAGLAMLSLAVAQTRMLHQALRGDLDPALLLAAHNEGTHVEPSEVVLAPFSDNEVLTRAKAELQRARRRLPRWRLG